MLAAPGPVTGGSFGQSESLASRNHGQVVFQSRTFAPISTPPVTVPLVFSLMVLPA